LENPYKEDDQALVFTGAMDYWANVDAVRWFADEVFPRVRARHPNAAFYIVGGKPTPQVRELARRDGIVVTGRVPDVRPYVKYARAVVCPLRIARGVQNKVLEGMAMARPVVASPEAFEGIDARPGEELIVADGRDAFVDAVTQILDGGHDRALGRRARVRVVENYGWERNLDILDRLLLGTQAHAGGP
ncbi:MAG: glycosyltransferase, partial [Alphaproteobacteria bacterium]